MTVQAVAEAGEYMSLNRALRYCGMSKCAWYHTGTPRKVPADPGTVSLVRQIAARRPTYGTRRMAAQVARQTGTPTNRKKIQKIYREIGWIEPKKTKNEIIRASRRRLSRPTGPCQLWETDITYIHCGADGWCYCFNVLDCLTRQWVAYVFDTSATAHTAVQSVLRAVSSAATTKDLRLRTDNGPQYGSHEFKKSMRLLGIRHEFIWKHTPEQNGHV